MQPHYSSYDDEFEFAILPGLLAQGSHPAPQPVGPQKQLGAPLAPVVNPIQAPLATIINPIQAQTIPVGQALLAQQIMQQGQVPPANPVGQAHTVLNAIQNQMAAEVAGPSINECLDQAIH